MPHISSVDAALYLSPAFFGWDAFAECEPVMNLVNCPCGHGLGRHSVAGCHGTNVGGNCSCDLVPKQALDAAIEAVRHKGPLIEEFSEMATDSVS